MRRPFALALGVLVLAGLQAPAAEEIYSRQCLAGCPDGSPDSNELVIREIYILASTPSQGIVLDPFNGSGTTTIFARTHNFRSIGIDLSLDYCEHAADALRHLDAALATPSEEGYDGLLGPGDD